MLNIDLAIKFGSNEIIIYRKGLGIVAKEPAYLAVLENGDKIKVKATGKRAEKLFHSRSSMVTVYQPIENSEIVNEKMATILLSEIISNVIADKFMLSRLTAVVAVPCGLNLEQLRLLKKVLLHSGINKVTFVQNAVCARENLELEPDKYSMIVDIGKFITDISILNKTDFHFGRMCFVGGNDMDVSITSFIMDNYNLEVSDMTSEAIKNEIASLYDRDMCKTEYIGIDTNDKFVKKEITANEVRLAVMNIYDKIFDMIKSVIDAQPKEIRAEINQNGILFVGGASAIPGLFEYASRKFDIPIAVAENAIDSVILGAGKLLSKKDYIKMSI